MRTHPVSSNRIEALERRVSRSTSKDQSVPAAWHDSYKRMKAKLLGFIEPKRVPWIYSDTAVSIPARYARAIAAYRQNNTKKALKEIDELIRLEPDNPYFFELKGQMLVDFGRVHEGANYYKKSVNMAPKSGLIRIDYGQALLERGQENAAITQLKRALQHEPRSARAHRMLARAYGRVGKTGEAALHLAEEAVLQGKALSNARRHAQSALDTLERHTPAWIRARDLMTHIENLENAKK